MYFGYILGDSVQNIILYKIPLVQNSSLNPSCKTAHYIPRAKQLITPLVQNNSLMILSNYTT